MATMTVQTITPAGVAATYAAVAASDKFGIDSGERHFLHVKNGSGASITVTIPAQKTSANIPGVGDVAIADLSIAVAAGADKMIGPITEAYRDAAGDVTANYSATTSVTAAALKLPKQ